MVNLGDRVKDPVSGWSGIAYCRIIYLQGCDRIGIQAPIEKDKDGLRVMPDLFHVDEPQLVVVKKNAITPAKPKKRLGGPSGFGPSGK